MAEIVGVLREMLLRMGLGFGVKDGGFGSEHSKGHVVDGDGEGEDQGYKDHGFIADRLDETIQNLCECFRTDSSSSDSIGVHRHASIPVVTNSFQSR